MNHTKSDVPKSLEVLDPTVIDFLQFITQAGMPIATLPPLKTSDGGEFYWKASKGKEPKLSRIKKYQPGHAIIAGTGVGLDVIDVDPRNGGDKTFEALKPLMPKVIVEVKTPGGGWHFYVKALGVASISFKGIDYLALKKQVFTTGTSRPKYGNKGYEVVTMSQLDPYAPADTRFYDEMLKRKYEHVQKASVESTVDVSQQKLFSEDTQLTGQHGLIAMAMEKVKAAQPGARHTTVRNQAFMLGHFNINDPHYPGIITQALLSACVDNGLAKEEGLDIVRTITTAITLGREDQRKEN